MNNSDYIEYQNRVQRQAKRIAELEAENKKLEAEIEMDAKKRRIMVNGYNRKCELVKELEATISISETTEPKWISVEDVLPQWGKLVKIKFKDGKEDERRFSADYKWVSKGMRTCESVNVTHWMPLPPPPTTEDSSAIEKEK